MSKKTPFCLNTFLSALTTCAVAMLVIASIALAVAPSCAVARGTGWSFLGIGKGSWQTVSAMAGLLTTLIGCCYLLLNWSRLSGCFTRDGRPTGEWLVGLAVCCICAAGVVADVTPFSQVNRWQESHHHHGSGGENGCETGGCRCGGHGGCSGSTAQVESDDSADSQAGSRMKEESESHTINP